MTNICSSHREIANAGASHGPSLRPAWFLSVLVTTYVLLHAVYFALPDRVLRDVVHHYAIVAPCSGLVNLLAPGEHVTAEPGRLSSPRVTLAIVRGCDGAGLAFLLLAGIVAFPARWKRKLAGACGMVLLSYLLNQARLVLLYFAMAFRQDWFDPLHNYFIPTFLIVVSVIAFSAWAAWAVPGRCAPPG